MFRIPHRQQVLICLLVEAKGGGSPDGIQVNPVGQVDEESHDGKAVELKGVLVDSYQGAFTLSRHVIKNEVVDLSEASSIKPTTTRASTTHSHHHRLLLVHYQLFS
jgi:hypothetical protein